MCRGDRNGELHRYRFCGVVPVGIRYRKYQSLVLSATKAIGFTAAMVSMLTLETTMLTVLIMAVYMIVKSTRELKKITIL